MIFLWVCILTLWHWPSLPEALSEVSFTCSVLTTPAYSNLVSMLPYLPFSIAHLPCLDHKSLSPNINELFTLELMGVHRALIIMLQILTFTAIKK